MKIDWILEGVLHVTCPTTQELCRAFFPLQEYYENRNFADKIFTRYEFDAWYEKEFPGRAYADDWSGFNIPMSVLAAFDADPRLVRLVRGDEKSEKLYDELEWYHDNYGSQIYVIGTEENVDPLTLDHELRHARYYLDSEYRGRTQLILLANGPHLRELSLHLWKMGYHSKVILDEIQAYVMCDKDYLIEQQLWTPDLDRVRKEIQALDR